MVDMARLSFRAPRATEQASTPASPPPEVSLLPEIEALDLREYGVELCPVPNLSPPQHRPLSRPGIRSMQPHDMLQPQSAFAQPARFSAADGVYRSSPFNYSTQNGISFLTPAPGQLPTTRNTSSAPTTPYLSAFRTSTDNLAVPTDTHLPLTSPTAEALSYFGPPPGNGPGVATGSVKKHKQRITIWTQEIAEVNEKQPTKPLPKPLKEWERIGRRVLKRRGQEEWPGPVQDGERVDKTGMYKQERLALSEGEYWGAHPSLNRGDGLQVDGATSPFRPSSALDGGGDPSLESPTRNVLIDNNDGANESPDALKLSPVTTSGDEVDYKRKAEKATDERLDRAAKLLAKEHGNARMNDGRLCRDIEGGVSEKPNEKPNEKPKRRLSLMSWTRGLGQKKA